MNNALAQRQILSSLRNRKNKGASSRGSDKHHAAVIAPCLRGGAIKNKMLVLNSGVRATFVLIVNAILLLGVALVLASCQIGPKYQRPSLETPEAYKSASIDPQKKDELELDWWHLFQDPELEDLCIKALEANQGLKAAMARVAQARASAASVRSGFFPVIAMNPSATRSGAPMQTALTGTESSLDSASSALSQASSILSAVDTLTQGEIPSLGAAGTLQSDNSDEGAARNSGNNFRIPFDVSYEIDIWGRIQRSHEAAQAEWRSSVQEMEVVRQTLLADVVRNYFNIRSLDAQHQILKNNLSLFEEQTQLTRKQLQAGLANETHALQAEIQLEATRAQTTDTLRQRTAIEHAIAILIGQPPARFTLEERTLTATLPSIPTGLPADLLCRRPDIAAAEQNLKAACAAIGAAEAEFYPAIKLVGSGGLQSAEIEDVLDWQNRTWSIGPSVSLPIFKGGQLKASLNKAKARYDELEAAYRESVLRAFQEVEDALTDIAARAEEAEARNKAVAAAREYHRLTQIQYQSGIVDYLHVINAEQTMMNNELSEVQIMNEQLVSTVLLIKALGGGWDANLGFGSYISQGFSGKQ